MPLYCNVFWWLSLSRAFELGYQPISLIYVHWAKLAKMFWSDDGCGSCCLLLHGRFVGIIS